MAIDPFGNWNKKKSIKQITQVEFNPDTSGRLSIRDKFRRLGKSNFAVNANEYLEGFPVNETVRYPENERKEYRRVKRSGKRYYG